MKKSAGVASGMDFHRLFNVVRHMHIEEIDNKQLISTATENIKNNFAVYEALSK